MDRRTFLAGLAGSAGFASSCGGVMPGGVTLEAVFGACLPRTLVIPAMTPLPDWFEWRAYQCSNPARLAALHDFVMTRSAIHPRLFELGTSLTYLVPFESLAERHRAWTLFDADPEWHRLRSAGKPVSLTEVTIYRPRK